MWLAVHLCYHVLILCFFLLQLEGMGQEKVTFSMVCELQFAAGTAVKHRYHVCNYCLLS